MTRCKERLRPWVTPRIGGAFGEFPVVVQESPEDSTTLWVQIFAVPAERVRGVKGFILGLQDEVSADSHVLLLPMVKNLAVTRQHYRREFVSSRRFRD